MSLDEALDVMALFLERTHGGPDDGDELVHMYCCNADVAWCGKDLTDCEDEPEPAPEHEMCVVCVDMERTVEFCSPGCPGRVEERSDA